LLQHALSCFNKKDQERRWSGASRPGSTYGLSLA
jgi:hypothetical protein